MRLKRCECGHQNLNHMPACIWEHCDCEGFVPRRKAKVELPVVFKGPKGTTDLSGHRRRRKTV